MTKPHGVVFHEFQVPGDPEPQRRHRTGQGRAYDDPRNLVYADRVRWAWRDAGSPPIDGAVALSVTATFKRPKNHWLKTGGLSTAGRRAGQWHTVRPDASNIGKAVEDALNGLAYEDDKLIANLRVTKYWQTTPQSPVGLIITLWQLPGGEAS